MIKREIKGITLIALIITIIVLLILAGITLGMLTGENSILKSAEIAKEETRGSSVKEARDLWFTEVMLAKRTGNTAKTLDEILTDLLNQRLLNSNEVNIIKTTENNEITIGSRTISFKIDVTNVEEPIEKMPKIGDYVAYTPDPVTVTGQTQIIKDLKTYSGYTETEYNTENQIRQENLSWRVLDITNGQVTLISDMPTTHTVRLQGTDGYNNGVKLLDDLCKTLYSKTGVGVSRSLKIEDIQNNIIIDYLTIDPDYGKNFTLTNKDYPNIFANENRQIVNGVTGKLGLSEQDRWYTGTGTAGTLNTTKTFWMKSMVTSDFKDNIYYNLFINNGSGYYNTYWLSSRFVSADSIDASFNVCYVDNSLVGATQLCDSGGGISYMYYYNLRPVVTLSSNVKIDTADTTKDGSTKELAWVLK